MPLDPDKCADAVESTMKRFGVKSRGVKFETNRTYTRVFISFNAPPSKEEMVFVSEQLQATTNAIVRPGKFGHSKVGFLFTEGPSMTDLPTKTTPRLPSPKTPKSPKSGTTKGSDGDYWKGFKKTR